MHARAKVPAARWATRLVSALVTALVGLALCAGPASAHTELLGSDPEQGSVLPSAPRTATLRFNEPIRVVAEAVTLLTAEGAELPSTATSVDTEVQVDLPGALAPGTYTLGWRVISADGHPVTGALVFSVGEASARAAAIPHDPATVRSTQVAIGVVQGLVYLGVFLAVGLVIFLRLLLPGAPAADHTRGRLLALARRGADVGFAASLLMLPLTTINQRGDGVTAIAQARSWEIDLGNPEPQAAILAFFGLALTVFTTGHRRLQVLLPVVGGAMALGSLALVGHSRSFGPSALVIASDVLHVLTGAVWLGGIVGLAVSLKYLGRMPDLALQTVGRFSTVAAGLLLTVGITGTLLTWRILGSFGAFVDTTFGRTLLVKLALVGLVVVTAAFNRWKLLPELRRRAGTGEGIAAAAVADRLRGMLRVEGLALVAVLLVTGVLVDRTPEPTGRSAAAATAPTSEVEGRAGDTVVTLTLDPARIGSNEVVLTVADRGGAPQTPYETPAISFVRGDLRIAGQSVAEQGPGTYGVTAVLPESGRWTAEVTVRLSEFESRVIPVRFRLAD